MPLDLSLSDMPWLGQPAQVNGGDIVNGILKGATGVMSLAKMKREREMEEVRFAQAQHEFKQKDEAFDQNKRSAALQMQGQEYQNVVLRNKATQTALQTAWETDNEEAMTEFQMLSYQIITGNQYDNPVLQDRISKLLSSNPKLLRNAESMKIFEMMTDGRQMWENNKSKLEVANVRAVAAEKESTQPEIKVITDPSTGKGVSAMRTGPNSWQVLNGSGSKDLTVREKDTLVSTRRQLQREKDTLNKMKAEVRLGGLSREEKDRPKNRDYFKAIQVQEAYVSKLESEMDVRYDKTETNSGLPNWLTPVDGEEDVFDYNPQ